MIIADHVELWGLLLGPVLITLGEIGNTGGGLVGKAFRYGSNAVLGGHLAAFDLFKSMFGAPDLKRAKPPPAPIDNSKAYFEELAKANIQRKLREGGGSTAAFKGAASPSKGTSLW
jgi:hypothetical protein